VSRTHKLDVIAATHRSRASMQPAAAQLDDRTWADLNLDDVYVAVDRTTSTLGRAALYHRVRAAPAAEHLDAFETLVTRMTDDTAARTRASRALDRLQEPNGYDLWWLEQPDAIDPRPWHVLFPLLGVTALVLLIASIRWPTMLPAFLGIVAVSVVVRYATDRGVFTRATAFRQLAPIIATGQALGFLNDAGASPITAPLSADVPRLTRLKAIARWVSGDPFMLAVNPNPLAGIATEVVSVVYEYLNLVFLLDANGVYFGGKDLRTHGRALLRVLTAIGDVDVAISDAALRAETSPWCRPVFVSAGSPITMTSARHPLVANAVPNTITLAAGRGLVVTGSNMSGKSTLLRTVGVNIVMAQTLHTSFAAEYSAPQLSVRSCIGRSDDIVSGKSYYMAEVEALLDLVRISARETPHMFLLDELFRGTNAVERIAAGQAVLRELLAGGGGHLHSALAATHDDELTDLLVDRYDAVHFGDDVGESGLVFDYRLKSGRATTRNAIALLKLNGAPERLLSDALACAAILDHQRAGR
jgi:hypothetical protein